MQEETIDYSKLSDDELIKLEKEYKNTYERLDTLQLAQKILLNSMYGSLGNTAFRYFDLNLATSITISGKLSIKWIERKLNELISKKTGIEKDRVVMIDTDSVVLDLEDLVKKYCPKDFSREKKLHFLMEYGEKVLNPYIDFCYKELAEYMNAYQQKMHMKRENAINSMINLAAKSYVMEVYDSEGVRYTLENPKMKIMGMVLVKSSTPKVIRTALKNSLPILLHGTEGELQDYIQKFKKEFKKFSVEEIAFPRSANGISTFTRGYWEDKLKAANTKNEREIAMNRLSEPSQIYTKGTPIHVKASLIYNSLLEKFGIEKLRKKIVDGDKIKFVYLKPNPTHEKCVGFQDSLPKEFGLTEYVDYDMMFEKTFMSPITDMCKPLGWSVEKKNDLSGLFF